MNLLTQIRIASIVNLLIVPQLATTQTLTPSAASNSKIAFQRNRDGNFEIFTMSADGSAITRLTNNAALDLEPAWSPDGQRIAFRSDRDGNFEIYVMNADGSGLTG
jgi:Tol biopolymer transport system component